MTFISNDPSYWPHISSNVFLSYWTAAAVVVMVYDWVLTLGPEIEHIWKKRWSLITVLYLIIRYIGIPYSIISVLQYMPSVPLTDTGCAITDYSVNGSIVILTDMLGGTLTRYIDQVQYLCDIDLIDTMQVIMISRLHAMYEGSRKMLVFLVIIYLIVNIFCGVIVVIALHETVMEELILSGMHTCDYGIGSDERLLISMAWGLNTVWEILALCLSVWVAVKHFRGLRKLAPSTGSTIGDWFRVLIQSHALYFASFVGVSCLHLAALSPEVAKSDIGVSILGSALQIFMVIQLFVLGPRLVLSIREHHAKLVAYSDAETTMNSIVFQEYVHASTSSTV